MSFSTICIIQLVLVFAATFNAATASTWLCTKCNGIPACIRECSKHNTTKTFATTETATTTTSMPSSTTLKTSTKWRLKTKPSWWKPLPCKLCYGWVGRRNETIRNICRYGCGNGQPGLTTKQPTTTTTTTTTLKTATTPSSTLRPSTTTHKLQRTTPAITETTTTEFRQQQRLSVRLSTVSRHINYVWFLIGVVGFVFLVTSFFIIRKYTAVKQRVGSINIHTGEDTEIIHISRPFTLP